MNNYNHFISDLEKQLEKVNENIDKTFNAFSEGLDPELCNEILENLNVVLYSQGIQETVKRGDYPRYISSGAGDRNRTGTGI